MSDYSSGAKGGQGDWSGHFMREIRELRAERDAALAEVERLKRELATRPSPPFAALGAFVVKVHDIDETRRDRDWAGLVALYHEVADTFRGDARRVAAATLGREVLPYLDAAEART